MMTKILLTCILTFITLSSTLAQHRASWMEQDRFGMFIHWGLYTAAEGMWKGEKLRYLNNYAEWIRYRNRISKDEYGQLAKRFVWDEINPEEWVIQAKKAGMKYIIMTTKHHDGVAIWDTKIGTYSISKLAGVDRDIIKELAEACRKHNMKLGFYYSHWIDWEHPYAWDHNQELTGRVTDAQFDTYWQDKVIPQLKELLTNYGDISIMWFDMWIPYEKSIIKRKQLEQVVQLIRELQPNCLINSRLGLPTDAKYVDFETLGDNVFGTTYRAHPWETPGTIAHSWGYNGQEKEWKSSSQIFESLISNVSLNGGLTLNIGPRANGQIPYESINRLNEIGRWLDQNGESIYGAKGLPMRANNFDWGYLTYKPNEQQPQVYAHIFNWPLDNCLRITGINNKPQKIYYKNKSTKTELTFDHQGSILHVNLPKESANDIVSNIVIEYNEVLAIDDKIVPESTYGGFALNSNNLLQKEDNTIIAYDGKRPSYFLASGAPLLWDVYFPKKGIYHIDISAHNPTHKNVAVEITIGENTIKALLQPNGKVVAEPNENNYTEEFVDTNVGYLKIDEIGKKPVTIKVIDNQPLWINRIWITR
ncbi:alpha-L-fucosidase [Sphingobacterium rhinopitheci]|uniref:alpha-L-fucosidase n=1 Tax=Sphingobacterium rhinopitheci TaxID=2781960 RepID=UPI001F5227B5|nr:alpha-L-fucosidase [Sphingobacterium rhinopitheci]MCI0920807.1 alpha-L-fucosidase [Sphingobacterium rhinopitheci]